MVVETVKQMASKPALSNILPEYQWMTERLVRHSALLVAFARITLYTPGGGDRGSDVGAA